MTRDAEHDHLAPWVAEGPSRVVFEHPYYHTLVEEDLRLPDGRVIQWLRFADHRDGVEHPDGVMAICVRDGQVLVSRQYNPGPERVVYEFPGGGTHPGESYEAAVRRELMEEVGFYPHGLNYLGRFLFNNRRTGWGIRTYLAWDLEARSLPADDAELIAFDFLPPAEVAELIRKGEIDNATLLSGWALLTSSDIDLEEIESEAAGR